MILRQSPRRAGRGHEGTTGLGPPPVLTRHGRSSSDGVRDPWSGSSAHDAHGHYRHRLGAVSGRPRAGARGSCALRQCRLGLFDRTRGARFAGTLDAAFGSSGDVAVWGVNPDSVAGRSGHFERDETAGPTTRNPHVTMPSFAPVALPDRLSTAFRIERQLWFSSVSCRRYRVPFGNIRQGFESEKCSVCRAGDRSPDLRISADPHLIRIFEPIFESRKLSVSSRKLG